MLKKAMILAVAPLAALSLLAACGDDSGTSNDALGIPDATGRPGITVNTDHGTAHGGETPCTAAVAKQTVVASNAHFDHHCLRGPANQPFTITLDNKDTASYNIAIFRNHADPTTIVYRCEYVQGPATGTCQVPALQPGQYAFHSEAATTSLGHGTLLIS